jgi:myo-inositol-1(or 4)-monophosphatase
MGEEGASRETGSDYRWYIDPLDGTTNFAHGFPVFCVSLGLDYKGERIAGVVYDPTRDELFAAEKGSGAWMNQKPIEVSKVSRVGESLGATGFPSHKRHKNPNIHFYHEITLRTHGVRRPGSAALDLANVASGRVDAFWEFNLNPWDTPAGVLLVQEAGGRVTDMTGGPWQLNSRETLASNGLVHDGYLEIMADIFAGRVGELPNPTAYRTIGNL